MLLLLRKSGPVVLPERPSAATHERLASLKRMPWASRVSRMASAVVKSRRVFASVRARSCATRSSLLIVAPAGVPILEAVTALGSVKKSGPKVLPLPRRERGDGGWVRGG